MSEVAVQVDTNNNVMVQVDSLAREVIVAAGIQGPPGATGPQGPAGPAAADLIYTAGAILGGHRMVVLNSNEELIYADSNIAAHAEKVLGMTVSSAVLGALTTVKRSGELTEPSWNWTLDTPIFLGVSGLLTQTPPTVGSFALQVAFPVAPTKVFIDIKQAFFFI